MSYLKKAYRGLHHHRFKREPLEKKFANAWQALDDTDSEVGTLRYLLCPPEVPQNRPPAVSDRDRLVAATVIQWLGSEVGKAFVAKVMGGKRLSAGKQAVFGRRSGR